MSKLQNDESQCKKWWGGGLHHKEIVSIKIAGAVHAKKDEHEGMKQNKNFGAKDEQTGAKAEQTEAYF